MFVSRISQTVRAVALGAVALALAAISGVAVSTAAHADAVPFWEQADIDAKKAKSRKAYGYKPSKSKAYGSKSGKKKYYAKKSSKKLGGYASATEPAKKKSKGVRVAALGNSYYPEQNAAPAKSLSGGGVRWVASAGCLNGSLKSVIYSVAANYGPVTVNSTCRSAGHNRRVGGAPKSKHLSGNAVDFRVRGNVGAVYAYLRSSGSVGGLKHYGGGLFHIDSGERRSW